ncbi:MAG TPA: M1 family aminopeptidase [Gaiellaceae bacterium]|nr:M1 family aminopeptidase [Gaiellaceae bacterium]
MHHPGLVKLAAAAALALALPAAASATTSRTEEGPGDAPDAATVFVPSIVHPSSALLAPDACSSGARTLSPFGARVYPEQGNGGYRSVHTDVHMVYDTASNLLLPGNHVDLTMRATQCLTDFSLDFERTNTLTAAGSGPNMTIDSVEVNGQPASFTFVQPTYPGDPNGQDDPDPAAHAISNANPVSATNPNPPACSPTVGGNSQNGGQCPATKLVITPAAPIADGSTFTVTVDYTGRPGVHPDGDGSTDGWFRVNTAAAPNDGSFVTTEPIGTFAWMPLNNHPSAKPTYDFYDTVPVGKTAIANGEIVGFSPPVAPVGGDVPVPPTSVNAPDASFPAGSWTWHWHSPEPIANYLVENSIGSYDLTGRTSPTSGIQYYEAQASAIAAARKATNKLAMDNQEDIVEFQRGFDGPWPLTTDGVIVGIPPASFEEEMQGKITFAGGTIGGSTGTSLGTFNHENMHQWFGDNVSEAGFNLTFWKEGFATLGEYLATARGAAGGASSGPAFENSLIGRFNTNYGTASSTFWTSAPSNPTVGNLFTTSFTYTRPGTAYLALWQALGRDRMIAAMQDIQGTYGGGSVTEQQLEAVFRKWLPVQSASCGARIDQFFPQWWDTSFPAGGAGTTNKPALTGPGLNGTGFVCGTVDPAAPTGRDGWYTGDVSVTWQGFGAQPFAKTGCEDGAVAEGVVTRSCSVTTTTAPILSSGAVSETVKHDSRPPVITYTGNAGDYTVDQTVSIRCSASDPTPGSGLDSDTCSDVDAPAYTLTLGSHTLSATAEDVAGNVGEGSTEFTVSVTFTSLAALVTRFSTDPDVTVGLNDKLAAAATAKSARARGNLLDAFANQVRAQTGKALTADQADVLLTLSDALR